MITVTPIPGPGRTPFYNLTCHRCGTDIADVDAAAIPIFVAGHRCPFSRTADELAVIDQVDAALRDAAARLAV